MPRVKSLLDCIGLALCDKARKALFGTVRFGEILPELAKAILDNAKRELPTAELRQAIAEMIALTPKQYSERVQKAIEGLARVQAIPFKDELAEYLRQLPSFTRQFLMRPSDPSGLTVPEQMNFFKAEELLPMLPPHRAKLKPGGEPAGLDGWKLRELLGVGETAETWLAEDAAEPGHFAAIKFAIDPEAQKLVSERQDIFHDVFKLVDEPGINRLGSVYLETDPPALESPYLSGYDLASLMWDWRWKYDGPKPEATLKLMRRMCDIVAKAHAKGVIHRGLKPSNIRLHPTEAGKFTLWVTDFGWGQISSTRSLLLSKNNTPRGEQLWLALRGAHAPLYASPQQVRKEEPDPRDDVYSLGVIWYQLLMRNPQAPAPAGPEWAEEMHAHGVTDSHARLLTACLSTRADKRPNNTRELSELLANVAVAPPQTGGTDGSKLLSIRGHSSMLQKAVESAAAATKAAAPVVAATLPGFGGLPRLVTNSVGITFSLIPPGRFLCGSPDDESSRREHEGPQREVIISKPFYLSIYPITQAVFERVMGRNPSAFPKARGGGPDFPVESVSWHDAEKFCEHLVRQTDEQLNGRHYRLPTEAEWEYACRAGTNTPFSFGDKITPREAHFASAGAFGKSGGTGHTSAVGKYTANAFGLYDMHGNVQEWVADWYEEFYYHEAPAEDPTGPDEGTMKVVRGGCWTAFGADCRSAARRAHPPENGNNTIGFRVALQVGG